MSEQLSLEEGAEDRCGTCRSKPTRTIYIGTMPVNFKGTERNNYAYLCGSCLIDFMLENPENFWFGQPTSTETVCDECTSVIEPGQTTLCHSCGNHDDCNNDDSNSPECDDCENQADISLCVTHAEQCAEHGCENQIDGLCNSCRDKHVVTLSFESNVSQPLAEPSVTYGTDSDGNEISYVRMP